MTHFHWPYESDHASQIALIASAFTTFGGCVGIVSHTQGAPTVVGIGGIIAAVTGFITAMGAIIIASLRIFADNRDRERQAIERQRVHEQEMADRRERQLEDRRRFDSQQAAEDRKAKLDRHDLAEKLQANTLRYELLQREMEALRRDEADADQRHELQLVAFREAQEIHRRWINQLLRITPGTSVLNVMAEVIEGDRMDVDTSQGIPQSADSPPSSGTAPGESVPGRMP